MTQSDRQSHVALARLILLQMIMLSALYAGIRPHPPVATPLFAIAPFLRASVSIYLSAIIVQPQASAPGRAPNVLAALMGLVSFGPQEYLDEQFGEIWPAVMLGQLAALVILVRVLRARRESYDPGLAVRPSAV